MESIVAAVAALFVVLGLLSGFMRRTALAAPMLALAAGVLLGPVGGVLPTSLDEGGVLLLAELTLALVLFVDATRVDLRLARRNGQVPARMLVLGLPLVIGLGTLAGVAVLGLTAPMAFVLACLLAPTDAALAQPVLTDERVPLRVRQALNVESGLNDGLVVPVLAVALVVVGADAGGATGGAELLATALRMVGWGLLVGAAVGGSVGGLLRVMGWRELQPAARQVGTAALPLLAFATAGLVGGNGFVAAFVTGLVFGALVEDAHELVEFGEDTGELLALLTFLVLGAVFIGPAAATFGLPVVLYALLSLTVVRMAPIGLSLLGLGLRRDTVAMLGWFGPRGLATVVFALEVLELTRSGHLPGGDALFGIAALVVVASVVLHGLSARPLAGAYAVRLGRVPTDAELPEHTEVDRIPLRRGRLGR